MIIPKSVCIDIIDDCNLKCTMCDRWRYYYKEQVKSLSDWGLWKRVIDECVTIGVENLTITGGEPLLYPHIIDVVSCASGKLSTDLISNGELLSDNFVDIFKELKISYHLSMDGSRIVHDKIRKMPGSFDRISSFSERLSDGSCYVRVNCVVRDENIDSLIEMTEQIKKWAKTITFQHQGFCPSNAKGYGYSEESKHLGRVRSSYGFLPEAPLSDESIIKLKSVMEFIEKSDFENVHFTPRIPISNIDNYYKNWEAKVPKSVCPYIIKSMRVKPDGTVAFCGWFYHKVGDLKIHSIAEIWNSDIITKYRLEIRDKIGYFESCKRCCALWS